jgi:Ca2+-binding RTX toxin-like protein
MTMAIKYGMPFSETIYGTDDDDLIFGYGGYDWIFGYGGNDILFGMDGDDDLNGGADADFLDGGSGFDTAWYDDSPAGVTVNLKAGFGSGGDAQGDLLMNIEKIVGSAYDDVLVGDDGHNFLEGGGGSDRLVGGGDDDNLLGDEGDDRLFGGSGDDFLFAGPGWDYLSGGDDNDRLWGSDGTDELRGGDGHDYLQGGGGNDYLFGGDGSDTFAFSASNVVIDKNGVIEHYADSAISDPDHIMDFQVDEIRDIADRIETPTAGTTTNYIETEIGYDAGYLEALKWAEYQIGTHWTFGLVTDRVDGYLFGDLNSDGVLETGIVLEGLTSLDDFDHWYIVQA